MDTTSNLPLRYRGISRRRSGRSIEMSGLCWVICVPASKALRPYVDRGSTATPIGVDRNNSQGFQDRQHRWLRETGTPCVSCEFAHPPVSPHIHSDIPFLCASHSSRRQMRSRKGFVHHDRGGSGKLFSSTFFVLIYY